MRPPFLKSLHISSPSILPLKILDLVRSLRSLEELALVGSAARATQRDNESDGPYCRSFLRFTGTLKLHLREVSHAGS
jgi:hypothetical protein